MVFVINCVKHDFSSPVKCLFAFCICLQIVSASPLRAALIATTVLLLNHFCVLQFFEALTYYFRNLRLSMNFYGSVVLLAIISELLTKEYIRIDVTGSNILAWFRSKNEEGD